MVLWTEDGMPIREAARRLNLTPPAQAGARRPRDQVRSRTASTVREARE